MEMMLGDKEPALGHTPEILRWGSFGGTNPPRIEGPPPPPATFDKYPGEGVAMKAE